MPPHLTALLIEDDPLQANTTASVLASAGFAVTIAPTGATGISALTKDHFHLAIVDLHLPDIPGARLIEVLRGAPNGPNVKIIAVTVSDDNAELRGAFLAGADDVYQKTIGLNVLSAKFESLAEKFKDAASTVSRLLMLEERMHAHSEELVACAAEKDAQIAEMSTLLRQIAADTASVREIVTAWNQAKLMVGTIKTVAAAAYAARYPVLLIGAVGTAIFAWFKTGLFFVHWPTK